MIGPTAMNLRFAFFGTIALGLSACAGTPVDPLGGMRIEKVGEKTYRVDGQTTLSFVQLEQLLADKHPPRIVVEQSLGMPDICVYNLGVKLDIPVWARTRSGNVVPIRFNIDFPDITITDVCR